MRLLSRPIRVPGPLAAQYLLWAEGLRHRDGQLSIYTASYRRIALGSKHHMSPDSYENTVSDRFHAGGARACLFSKSRYAHLRSSPDRRPESIIETVISPVIRHRRQRKSDV